MSSYTEKKQCKSDWEPKNLSSYEDSTVQAKANDHSSDFDAAGPGNC